MSKWITRWFGRDLPDEKLTECRGKLYRLAYAWCNDKQLAEDVVQETLMKAWQYRDKVRQDEAEMAWLCRVLRNTLTDYFRRHGKVTMMELDDELCVLTDRTPEELCLQEDMVHHVRDAVSQLPLLQRQMITLVDLEGMSYTQVAAILDIPVGTVMSRLSRARDALRNQLLLDQTTTQRVSYMRRVK
ncbi:MAG: RNA polymerase sigma factor [Thiotrichales bacterium]|nr:RNA polymerase sigma factor [Thiotrichales bacterium]